MEAEKLHALQETINELKQATDKLVSELAKRDKIIELQQKMIDMYEIKSNSLALDPEHLN